MNRLSEIRQLILFRTALSVLLLLCLNGVLALLSKEELAIRLVLLVLAHDLVELGVRVLHILHQVLRRFPRQPAAHTTDHEIVLRVLTLENLAPQLRLLVRREGTADLHTTNIALEVVLAVIRLLNLLLVLEEEHLVLLRNIRALDSLAVNLLELVDILHDILNLELVLLRDVGDEVLEPLDLPVVVHPLDELLEEVILLLGDDLLGREEGDNAVALVGELGVLIEVVDNTILIVYGQLNLLRTHLYY